MSTKTISITEVLYPIISVLSQGQKHLETTNLWVGINEKQKEFLAKYQGLFSQADSLKEIESLVSENVETINKFLKDHGFDIQLVLDNSGLPTFYVASILNVLVEWIQAGEITEIKSAGQTYPAFELKTEANRVSLIKRANHAQPIIEIQTKTQDIVCLTIYDGDQSKLEDLTNLIQAISVSSGSPCFDYSGVVIPMIDYNQEVDISWILKMEIKDKGGVPWFISQAKQQTKFRMNEKGARAESAVAAAITMRCCIMPPKPKLIIDKPFLLWIKRPGLDLPLFAGYFTQDSWKRPKNLD